MGNPFGVDRTFVVSVKALREVLEGISSEKAGRWWVEGESEHGVVVGHQEPWADDINRILFEFPKIAEVPFPDGDGEIICLYPNSRGAVQRGLYWQRADGGGRELLNDEIRDWEEFWPPIRQALARRYSEGSGVRSL